jgi:23S rRNA (guanosine2251-2'-O)-methyltransferase
MLYHNAIPLVIILHNVRSAQNVGAIFRTADAAGVQQVVATGYTPHPWYLDDSRPPHIATSNTRAISKTALGAEQNVPWCYYPTLQAAIAYWRHKHYVIAALEQTESSKDLFSYPHSQPMALVVGNEVTGLEPSDLALCDVTLELPMLGTKESLNVATAAGIALYQLQFSYDRHK